MSAARDRERLDTLLAEGAVEALSGAEAAELEALLAAEPAADAESMERAAAAIQLAFAGDAEPLPAALEGAIRRQAREHLAAASPQPTSRSEGPGEPPPRAEVVPLAPRRPGRTMQLAGWWAAAACLVLAAAAWLVRPEAPAPGGVPPEAVRRAEDSLAIAWKGTEDPAAEGAGGEVVWSNALQAGFMRFSGLPANDPGEYQYQLWIFDAEQDGRYPVDGGVFDVPEGAGETLVPIDARIAVAEPTLFAVTIEKPGGVVVSGRERLVLIAPATAG